MAFSDLFQTLYWKDIQYKTYEKILAEVLKTKIASFGHGSEQTVFPNCKITLTNQRIIISQKMLWRNKYREHYFIWLKDDQEISTLNKGMIELSYSKFRKPVGESRIYNHTEEYCLYYKTYSL